MFFWDVFISMIISHINQKREKNNSQFENFIFLSGYTERKKKCKRNRLAKQNGAFHWINHAMASPPHQEWKLMSCSDNSCVKILTWLLIGCSLLCRQLGGSLNVDTTLDLDHDS